MMTLYYVKMTTQVNNKICCDLDGTFQWQIQRQLQKFALVFTSIHFMFNHLYIGQYCLLFNHLYIGQYCLLFNHLYIGQYCLLFNHLYIGQYCLLFNHLYIGPYKNSLSQQKQTPLLQSIALQVLVLYKDRLYIKQ